ncbi:heat-labile enterotoxin alpha chain domain-containing protein [Hirsutella rhossiliensis]|uniref:Heat-labile enterotoxin alpha chain domain-containing protein n=1 Tax=Hirsutella rhossiliensis TaxID=111463 RepID=A0A9P8SLP0_9HYPO|nr:heat-labile enterotoxin alpha chain domain-containing protein [Hirsutella rhossiliensis]KAH0967698.1 heat-labile enterotoxin alpha chain domain-containing protein [Hirsutella rhossiliensis]
MDMAKERGGYVFAVSPDKKTIDVNNSLGKFSPHPEELEYVMLNGAEPGQIKGHMKVEKGAQWQKIEIPIGKDDPLPKGFNANQGYDALYQRTGDISARPELAGFPPNHKAWKEDSWKDFKKKSLEESVENILSQACGKKSKRDLACYAIDKPNGGKTDVAPDGNKVPTEGKGPKSKALTNNDVAKAADDFSKTYFEKSLDKYKLRQVAKNAKQPITFTSLRDKLSTSYSKGFRKLTTVTFNPRFKGGLALEGPQLILWSKSMLEVFAKESTALEQVAVSTSIIPLVGCFTQGAADAEKGKPNYFDTALCAVADRLTLSPAWPFGVGLHLLRTVVPVSGFLFNAGKEWAEASEWAASISKLPGDRPEHYQSVWAEYRSKAFEQFKSPEVAAMIDAQFSSEMIGVLFLAAGTAGSMRAISLQASITNSTTDDQISKLGKAGNVLMEGKLETQICLSILDKKKRLQRDLEKGILDKLEELYGEFDKQYFETAKAKYAIWYKESYRTQADEDPGYFINRMQSGAEDAARISKEVTDKLTVLGPCQRIQVCSDDRPMAALFTAALEVT